MELDNGGAAVDPLSPAPSADRFELAVAAMIKDEGVYLEEWIAYHHALGVEHFFLYDNGSSDDTNTTLQRYINHGLVTLTHWPLYGGQIEALRHALFFIGPRTEWLALIDPDEFVVPQLDPDLPTFLARFDADQVVIPWRNFGFSGHRTRPDGLVIESYDRAQDEPEGGLPTVRVKAIVRPDGVVGMNVHGCRTRRGNTVDPHGDRVAEGAQLQRPRFDVAQINHYYTKSYEEFAAKIARGGAEAGPPRRVYTPDEEAGYTTLDTSIARFVSGVKAHLTELQALSPSPFRYGSLTPVHALRRETFRGHAVTALANYVHRAPAVSRRHDPIDDVGPGGSHVVVERPLSPHALDDEPLLASEHIRFLLDRVGAKQIAGSCACAANGHGDVTTARFACDPRSRSHRLLVADLEATERASVTAMVEARPLRVAPSIEVRAGRRYLWIADLDPSPTRATAVRVETRPSGTVTFYALTVCAYG